MESHDGKTNDKSFSGPEGNRNDSPGEFSQSGANQQPKPAISERKLAANRLNAQRSTGPKTPDGKRRSSQNAYRSGIFARQLFFNTDAGRKEWEAYEGFAAAMYEHYQPVGIMEEMLVDRVVSAAVRSARVLWFETEAFARKDTFWGNCIDKVLRYQTTTDRQLTKAIELLEDAQRNRQQATGRGEIDSGSGCGDVPTNPSDMPLAPGAADQGRLALEPSSLPSTNQVPAALPNEAIARYSCAPTFGAVPPGRNEDSSGVPQETENYKTKPPTPILSGESDYTGHEKARQKHSFTEIAERVAGLAASPDSNDEHMPTLDSGNKSVDATVPGTTQDEILDCL